jgi:hypothetical protein
MAENCRSLFKCFLLLQARSREGVLLVWSQSVISRTIARFISLRRLPGVFEKGDDVFLSWMLLASMNAAPV